MAKSNEKTPRSPCALIAHRGASGLAPENTRAALRKACEIGVDCIEIDVRLTGDQIPVLLHDASLKRIGPKSQKHSPINHSPLQTLKGYDIGSWFDPKFSKERLITLADALALCQKQVPLMIEIKRDTHPPQVIVDAIFQALVANRSAWKHLFVGSFSYPVLALFKEKLQRTKLPIELIGIADKSDCISPFVDLGIGRLALWHKLITPKLIDPLNKKKIPIWSFTVNNREEAEALAALGVQGIITNFPNRLKKK